MSKQDRQGVRKASDIEQKYNLGQLATAQGATTKQAMALQQLSQTLSQYMADTNAELEDLDSKIDEIEREPGEPGFSPIIDVTEIEGGHKITITDAEGKNSFEVMDGTSVINGFVEDETFPGCYYHMVGEEKEWLNPPMIIAEEYRTIDRYMGNPVYIQLIDFGALPNADRKSVQTNINGANAFDLQINIHMGNGQITDFPYVSTAYDAMTRAYLNSAGSLTMDAKTDLTSYTAKVTIKYIKP